MPDLLKILTKSSAYTKDHKILWFFGFFITSGSLSSLIWFSGSRHDQFYFVEHAGPIIRNILHSNLLTAFLAGLVLMFIIMFAISSIAKIVVISAANRLEQKERPDIKKILNSSSKYFWRTFSITVLISLLTFIIFAWLAVPIWLLFARGSQFSAVLLLFIGISIFIPVFMVCSLVNIFSVLFVVVYNLKFKDALKSGLDLFTRFAPSALSLILVLFIVYIGIFFISMSLLGFIFLLAYFLQILLKSLSIPLAFGLTFISLAMPSLVFITVNSILNVFTTITWTIFFLEIVKANPLPEPVPAAEPVM